MSALITQSGCSLELSLPISTSKCKCKYTYIIFFTLEFKCAQSWSKSVNFMLFAYFAIFNKLYNFVLRATFFIQYETYPNLQGRPLAINTELQGSKCSPRFGDF